MLHLLVEPAAAHNGELIERLDRDIEYPAGAVLMPDPGDRPVDFSTFNPRDFRRMTDEDNRFPSRQSITASDRHTPCHHYPQRRCRPSRSPRLAS